MYHSTAAIHIFERSLVIPDPTVHVILAKVIELVTLFFARTRELRLGMPRSFSTNYKLLYQKSFHGCVKDQEMVSANIHCFI